MAILANPFLAEILEKYAFLPCNYPSVATRLDASNTFKTQKIVSSFVDCLNSF